MEDRHIVDNKERKWFVYIHWIRY